jgi:uncharacterized membrane protein
MEDILKGFASASALLLELLVVLFVLFGAMQMLVRAALRIAERDQTLQWRRDVWLRLASWILLALELALGADLIRTAIAPSWDDIGKLAAIAALRTGLGFFLGSDLDRAERDELAAVSSREDTGRNPDPASAADLS